MNGPEARIAALLAERSELQDRHLEVIIERNQLRKQRDELAAMIRELAYGDVEAWGPTTRRAAALLKRVEEAK